MYFIYIIVPQPAWMQYIQDPGGVELVCEKDGRSSSISGVRSEETEVSDGFANTEAALPKCSTRNLLKEG